MIAIVRAARFQTFMAVLFLLLVGCATQQYDAISDKKLSDLQEKIETKIFELQGVNAQLATNPSSTLRNQLVKKASYAENSGFYDDILGGFASIGIRLRSFSSVETTRNYIEVTLAALQEDIIQFRNVHMRNDKLTAAELDAFRLQVRAKINAINVINSLGRPEKK
jgi:hypothetical protein